MIFYVNFRKSHSGPPPFLGATILKIVISVNDSTCYEPFLWQCGVGIGTPNPFLHLDFSRREKLMRSHISRGKKYESKSQEIPPSVSRSLLLVCMTDGARLLCFLFLIPRKPKQMWELGCGRFGCRQNGKGDGWRATTTEREGEREALQISLFKKCVSENCILFEKSLILDISRRRWRIFGRLLRHHVIWWDRSADRWPHQLM